MAVLSLDLTFFPFWLDSSFFWSDGSLFGSICLFFQIIPFPLWICIWISTILFPNLIIFLFIYIFFTFTWYYFILSSAQISFYFLTLFLLIRLYILLWFNQSFFRSGLCSPAPIGLILMLTVIVSGVFQLNTVPVVEMLSLNFGNARQFTLPLFFYINFNNKMFVISNLKTFICFSLRSVFLTFLFSSLHSWSESDVLQGNKAPCIPVNFISFLGLMS